MNTTFAAISPDAIFTAGLLLVVWFVLRWSRNRKGGRRRDERFAGCATTGSPESRPQTPPASLDQWEVRMHELARDLSAQLDTKIRIVQQLVLRAEQQSGRLEAAINRAQQMLEPDGVSPASSSANVPENEALAGLKRRAALAAEIAELDAGKKAAN
jgi:hypothetical protein